jgi:hypothetical protein
MGQGLREFGEGLVAAILGKVTKRNTNLSEQLARETDQISILSEFLQREIKSVKGSAEEGSVMAFLGLVLMSKGLLGDLVTDRGGATDLPETIEANVERLIHLLRTFEESYDRLAEPASAVKRTAVAWEEVKPLLLQDPRVHS